MKRLRPCHVPSAYGADGLPKLQHTYADWPVTTWTYLRRDVDKRLVRFMLCCVQACLQQPSRFRLCVMVDSTKAAGGTHMYS